MFIILGQALLELEEKCKAMGDEIALLRKYVEQLEADNAAMQEIIRKKNTAVSGKSNLQALFKAGFHICPSYFGQVRESECMFCASFIDKEQVKEEEFFSEDHD